MAGSRPASPTHYDFLPKTASPTSAGTKSAPSNLEKLPAEHPPSTPLVHHRKTDSAATSAAEDDDTDSETNSDDEFNWDADEDGKSIAAKSTGKKAKRGRRLWLLYLKLSKPIRTFLIAVIFGGILVTPALVFLLRFPHSDSKIKPHVVAWSLWLSISWGVACALSLIVDFVPHLILWIVFVFYGKAPEAFKTQLELIMAISFWLKLALQISGMWVTLGLMRRILNPPGRYWNTINEVMSAVFAAGIIFLVEKTFVRIIAIRFHQKALADRLQENRIALKALDKLSNALPQLIPTIRKKRHSHGGSMDAHVTLNAVSQGPTPYSSRPGTPDLKVKGGAHKKEYSMESPERSHTGSGSGTPTNRSSRLKPWKRGKVVTDLLVDQLVDLKDAIGQVALKDSKFNRQGEIGSLYSARRLAKQLFSTLSNVYPPRSHLIVEDFYPYFKTQADAQIAFSHFDKDNNGDISKREMREAVQRIYRERKDLSASLKDMSSAVAKLDAVMVGLSLIIILFVCILIFNPSDSLTSLIPLATIVLGFSFIFGNSAKTIFESLIFIFSTHVYDVGDLVIIDDQVLMVKEFGLFATTFRRVDGQEVVAPNQLLGTVKLIHNLRRSGSMWESTNLQISYDTPLEIIEQLKVRLRQYMTANNREWGTPGVEIWIDSMKNQNCLNLVVSTEHRNSWQEWGPRWARRGLFMKHLRSVLEELEITYQLPVQPIAWHPASAPPPWMSGSSTSGSSTMLPSASSGNLSAANLGFAPRDPMRNF